MIRKFTLSFKTSQIIVLLDRM